MLIMTTKVDKRKLLIAAVAVVAAIALLAALGGGDSAPTASMSTAPAADTNDARVKFLTDLGRFTAADVHMVARAEGKQLLLDVGHFLLGGIVHMELLALGEDLAFDGVFFLAHGIHDGELIADGEDPLLDVQFHGNALLSNSLFS